uniref:Uncharacterized protein n=1 Tax=Tetranychus urticae TaxID=32264 RepID=T1K6Z4_TETUR
MQYGSFKLEAKNSCNDECSTKKYCISSDGSGVCSNNNLATAKFAVVPDFGTYDYLQLTLTGYNVTSDAEKTITLSFDRFGSPINRYTCYKSSNGSFGARFDRSSLSLTTGSSYYKDGVLNCTWTFNRYDLIWPMGVDLFKDDITQSISLYHDSQKVLVAPNITQLPIYHAQYLKCCNKVHGNGAFSLTFDQTDKQIRYRLYNWEYIKEMTITLTRQDGIGLKFVVHLYENVIYAYIINVYTYKNDQLMKPFVYAGKMCSWTTPLILGDTQISFDASTSVFDLQVEVNDVIVYDEKGVELKS